MYEHPQKVRYVIFCSAFLQILKSKNQNIKGVKQ